jgi:hypothetical protein
MQRGAHEKTPVVAGVWAITLFVSCCSSFAFPLDSVVDSVCVKLVTPLVCVDRVVKRTLDPVFSSWANNCDCNFHRFAFRGWLSLAFVARMHRVYRQIVDASTTLWKVFGKLSKNVREWVVA